MNSKCVICNKNLEILTNYCDLPICKDCLKNQAENLKLYHNQMKEDFKKNPQKILYKAEIDLILPDKLYLGNYEAAESLELLLEKKITHILVCGEFLDINFPNQFEYHQIPIQDSLTQPILQYIEPAIKFIDKGTCVFVHCAAGINRSPAMVCAYLMKKNSWNYEIAFNYVKSKRPKANRQSNFAEQLIIYEQQISKQ